MSWQKALYDLNLPWNATDYDITSAFHQQQIQSPTLIDDMTQTTMRRRLCSTIAGVSAHNILLQPWDDAQADYHEFSRLYMYPSHLKDIQGVAYSTLVATNRGHTDSF